MKEFMILFLMASLGITRTEAEEKAEKVESDEEARKALFDLHKTKVAEMKQTATDNGYKKGTKEVKFAFERDLKEKFALDSDKQGLELVEELVAARTETAKDPAAISVDVVKKHPAYLELENKAKAEKTEIEKTYADKLKEVETAQAKKETFKTVAETAIIEFDSMNPILSADPAKAAKQKQLLIKQLEAGNYQVEGKTILLLDETGKRREDEHGNPIKFNDYVRGIADDLGFDYKAAEDRSSAGSDKGTNPGGQGGGAKKYTGQMPTNAAEYNKMLFNPELSADQKAEIKQHWEAQPK